jgi:DNA-binding transcriptional ArsR family regulator
MTKQPPMTDRVLEALAAIQHGTVDDIMHNLQGLQRTQVTRALSRLQQAGLLRCDGYRRGRDTGVRGGSLPGIYYLTGEYKPRPTVVQKLVPQPPASVFHLGAERALVRWPPAFEGAREFAPLGGWSLESDVCEMEAA